MSCCNNCNPCTNCCSTPGASGINNVCCPPGWKPQYTAYPEGQTIFEALCNWVATLNEVIDKLNELTTEVDNAVTKEELNNDYQLYAVDEQVDGYANFNGAWQGVTDPALSDPGIAGQVILNRDNIEDLQNEVIVLDDRITYLETSEFIDVTLFGVDNTGNIEINTSLQALLDISLTLGGVNLHFPAGEYLVVGSLEVYSNTYWRASEGATFRRDPNDVNNRFITIGANATSAGYGSGGSNITFDGGKYVGWQPTQSGMSITMHHVDNVVAKNMHFEMAMYFGHCFDVIGCRYIIFDNCTFEGYEIVTDRDFTEAIQIDFSYQGAGNNIGTFYDLLATTDVTVQNCITKAIYFNDQTVQYYGPTLVGSHSYGVNYYERIKIINNTYIDCYPRGDLTYVGAWIRFYAVNELLIDGNNFVNTQGIFNTVISIQTKTDGRDIFGNPIDLVSPPTNINIVNNTFKGFTSDDNTSRNALVNAYGREFNNIVYLLENLTVANNQAIDCSPGVDLVGPHFCYNNQCQNVNVIGNNINAIRGLFFSLNTGIMRRVNISNNIVNATTYNPCHCNNVDGLVISSNTFSNINGNIWLGSCNNVNVTNNTTNGINQNAGTTDNRLVRISGTNNVNCSGNVYRNVGANVVEGIYTSTNATGVSVNANVIQSNLGANAIVSTGTVTEYVELGNNTYA